MTDDDGEVEMFAVLSSDEVLEKRKQAAIKKGDFLDLTD